MKAIDRGKEWNTEEKIRFNLWNTENEELNRNSNKLIKIVLTGGHKSKTSWL